MTGKDANGRGRTVSSCALGAAFWAVCAAASSPAVAGDGWSDPEIWNGYLRAYGRVVTQGDRLELAVEGEGNFLLHGRGRDLLVRQGAFEIAGDLFVIDPLTGYRLQRATPAGEAFGFQDPASSDIRIPYDRALAPTATTTIRLSGNLTANWDTHAATVQILRSGISYTTGQRFQADDNTLLKDLDQASGLMEGDWIRIDATRRDGTSVSAQFDITDPAPQTLGDLTTAINQAYGGTGTMADVVAGELYVTDAQAGASLTDLNLAYQGGGHLELPGHFEIESLGGLATAHVTVEVFDSQGANSVMQMGFARTDTNTWDLVLTKASGAAEIVERRVTGISFSTRGRYEGLVDGQAGPAAFEVRFPNDPDRPITLWLDLGTPGESGGLTNFGGATTVAALQDGNMAGWLADMTVMQDGMLVGHFTNGLDAEIAQISVVVVPEPVTLSLLVAGVVVLARRRGARRARAPGAPGSCRVHIDSMGWAGSRLPRA